MDRRLIWIERSTFRGWGCSECAWVYGPSGPPTANSIDQMKQEYLRERDMEFAAHTCANFTKAGKGPPQN